MTERQRMKDTGALDSIQGKETVSTATEGLFFRGTEKVNT
jgi:hypothetical protein